MFRTIKTLLARTDYRVQSRPIIMGIFMGINVLLGANLLAEILIGLEGTSLLANAVFFVISVGMTLAYWRWPEARWIHSTIVIFCFCLLEGMFLTRPVNFHAIHYWFVLLMLVAFIVEGMRAAQIWFLIVIATFFINAAYIEYLFDGRYPMEVKTGPYLSSHLIFLFGVFAGSLLLYRLLGDAYAGMKQKTEELKLLQDEISAKKSILEKYQNTLLTLTRKEATLTGNVAAIVRAISVAAARALEVSHVGVWFFRSEGQTLVRTFQLTPRGVLDAEAEIHRAQFPNYFKALKNQPFILASHAATHPDTCEFAANYIHQDRIVSMLDCPILLDGEVLGMISCEQQDHPRQWQLEDALFVQSLADFIAMGTQNERIKNLLRQIRQQNADLTEKNNEIGTLNEELTSANEQLADLNRNLEAAVRKRTHELEFQNQQLTEYAFINSHLLRAPLARILGLAHVITREVNTLQEKELLHALEQSANELDQIIRKISELLYAGNNFSRENINEIIQRKFHQQD